MAENYMGRYLGQLVGKTVTSLATDGEQDDSDTTWGLVFSDGTIAWISCDPEGNGPGHLDIESRGK
jgi:hypothetical protein